jgi:hypothetical protein
MSSIKIGWKKVKRDSIQSWNIFQSMGNACEIEEFHRVMLTNDIEP